MKATLIANESYFIYVSIAKQQMQVYQAGEPLLEYAISTAKNGPGEQMNSECTPRGLHLIRAKVGAGAPSDAVFVGRRHTGEIYTPNLQAAYPARDWILTRIFWLSGLETGKNRLGKVDTMRRYVYIHGTPDCVQMGKPGSHGCIRMRNDDIITLFDRAPVYTKVLIE